METEQQAIHHAPGARLITEQGELNRKIVEMRGDEVVHAARIRRKRRAVGIGKRDVGVFRDPAHTQLARVAVAFHQRGAQNFSQRAAREAPQGVHLKKPVLCGDVPLQEKCVFLIGGANVRFAMRVEDHAGGRRERSVNRAGTLRQRPPHVPINHSECRDQRHGDRYVHNFYCVR